MTLNKIPVRLYKSRSDVFTEVSGASKCPNARMPTFFSHSPGTQQKGRADKTSCKSVIRHCLQWRSARVLFNGRDRGRDRVIVVSYHPRSCVDGFFHFAGWWAYLGLCQYNDEILINIGNQVELVFYNWESFSFKFLTNSHFYKLNF